MINEILADKTSKPKEKTEAIAALLVSKKLSVSDLLNQAKSLKESPKATCIEAIEFVTHTDKTIVKEKDLDYIISCLADRAPRIKWESAKVIANTISLYPKKVESALPLLLTNTEHTGTVVRWSAATAIAEIVKLNQKNNETLLPTVNSIVEREEKNSIKKIYLQAIKKLK